MQIIDMRLRPPTRSWLTKPQYKRDSPDETIPPARIGFPRARSAQEGSMQLLLSEMDEAGIRYGVVMGRKSAEPFGKIPNSEIAELIHQHPDRFLAFMGIDVSQPTHACLAECKRYASVPGFVGASIEPAVSGTPMSCDDNRLYPIYDFCEQNNLPISVSLSNLLCAMAGTPIEFSSPLPLYRVAKDFPKLDIVVSHGAWPWVREMLGVAFICPRVWVSPDLYMVGRNMPGAEDYVKAANMYLSERTLFGTAYPTRPLVESVQVFAEWSFAPGVQEKVLWKNAMRLMRLT